MTGVYFQMARGRAIARGNAMKTARKIKRSLDGGDLDSLRAWIKPASIAYQLSPEGVREVVAHYLKLEVKAARQANRDWRRLRASHLEFERE